MEFGNWEFRLKGLNDLYVRPQDQRDSRGSRPRCLSSWRRYAPQRRSPRRRRRPRKAWDAGGRCLYRSSRTTATLKRTSSAPSRRGTTPPAPRPPAVKRPPASSRWRATSSRRKTSTWTAICGWTSGTTAATVRSRSTPSGATTRADPGRSKTTIRKQQHGATAIATTHAKPSSARIHSRPRASTTKRYSQRRRRVADRPRTRRTPCPTGTAATRGT